MKQLFLRILFPFILLTLFKASAFSQKHKHECTGMPRVDVNEKEENYFRNLPQVLGDMDYTNYESDPTITENLIYLDFDGGLIIDPYWDKNAINAAPASYFNASQKLLIAQVVAADFEPFKVNITTRRDLYENSTGNKLRVVFTPTDYFKPGVGGVARNGSFGQGVNTAWVFHQSTTYAGRAASHEIGHTMGLDHDGLKNGDEYYGGHNGWLPIMGFGTAAMCQWSRGEYANADNPQDDVKFIADKLGFREDDFGSSNIPSALKSIMIDGNGNFKADGLITQASDQDVFIFKVNDGGYINLNFGCANTGYLTNLRIEAALYDINWNKIASVNTVSLSANLNRALSEGIYYLVFDGIGYLNPLSNGYSDYGSIGKYTFSGNVSQFNDAISDIAILSNIKLPKYTCDEKIEVDVTVINSGSQVINNYTLSLIEGNGNEINYTYNTPLEVGESRVERISIIPSNFRLWSGEITAVCSNDLLPGNNKVVLGSTNYYYGHNIKAEITTAATDFPYATDWKLYDENGTLLLNYLNAKNEYINTVRSSQFCYPKDSCFKLEITNPFKTEWCTNADFEKYAFPGSRYDNNHVWEKGDTVSYQSLVVLKNSNGWVGFELFMHNPFVEPNEYEFITLNCPPKEDYQFTFTNLNTNEVFISESYVKDGPSTYNYDYCTYEIVTSAPVHKKDRQYRIFPNPSNSLINIVTLDVVNFVEIYTIDGKLVLIDQQNQVNISSLPKGMYFVVINGLRESVQKLIVN
jgi:hypothetical protein